jgi:ABC-2 type transport system ATP-binding protein
MSAVIVHDLTHVYPPAARGGAPRKALDGLSFEVPAGSLFGVLGPNGGGKTTLFRILSTALIPGGGRATLGGADLGADPLAVRRKIGVVFQNPSLDKKLTVWENVVFQGSLYGLSGADLSARAEALLRRVGLWDRKEDAAEKLSGGLQRRVEIAKGLLHKPEILLMDEPTTGLDPGARRDLWAYLAELKKEGVTVLVTTHLMEEAERCDGLLIVHQGRRVAAGTPAALKAEIGGDIVSAQSPDPARLAAGLKEKFSAEALVVENVVRLERPEGPRFVPQLVESFPGLVESVTVGKPTLEDVFVRHTGHRFWNEAPAPAPAKGRKR